MRDASGQTMAIYHKEAGNGHPISQQELPIYGSGKLGMAFKNPDHYKYIYELTDHLGNVRALVTKLGLMATATMELEEDDYERQYFDNLSLRHADEVYNHTNQGLYGALTDPNYPVGPTTTLRVKAGDEINLEAFARFTLTDDFDPSVLTNDFLTALTSSVNGGAIGVEGDGLMQGISDILNSGDVIVNAKSGAPKAYLQYILLNDNFEYVGSDSYAVSDTEDTWQEMSLGTTATADGYLFAYVVNESNEPVYFDDFSFQILGNRAIRKTDYYPFGAVAKVWEEETEKEEVPTNTGTDLSGNLTDKNADSDWFGDELRVYTTTAILEEQSYAEFTVPTTAGQEYTFSYLYTLKEQVGTGYNYTQLYIDGIQEISDHSSREDSFIQEDVTFLATGAETVFRFSNYFEPALYPGQELNITISHLALKDVTLTEGTAPPDLMQISSSTEAYRYGYQGQYAEQDTITGWNAFELRMYDPLIGRWMQVDPAGQHASPYLSFSNNPINRVDPDGGWDKFKMDADGNITRTEVDLTDPYDHLYDVDGNLIAGNIRKGVLDDGQNFLTKFNMIDLTFDELSMDIPNSASAQSFVLQLSMHLEKEIAGFQMSSDNGVKLLVVPSAMNDFKTSRSITWLESRSGKIWTRYASKDVLFKGQEFKMISWFHTHPGKAGVDWSGNVKPSSGDQTWTNNFGVPGHIYGGKGGFNTIYPTK